MGNGGSSAEQEPDEVELEQEAPQKITVQVDPALLEGLKANIEAAAGEAAGTEAARGGGGGDPRLQAAFDQGRMVGLQQSVSQLQRGEASQKEEVRSLTESIKVQQFRVPEGEPACQEEQEAVLKCYRGDADVLACGKVVDAFDQCATKAVLQS